MTSASTARPDADRRHLRRSARRGATPIVAAHFAVDLAAGAFLATLPATVDRLGSGGGTFGLVVALFSVTALGLQPVLGRFADRLGLQVTTAAAGAVSAILLMATIAAPNLGWLVLGTIAGGLASGTFHPAGAALTRVMAAATPEAAIAAFSAAGTFGLAIGPIAGIALLGRDATGMLLLAVPALAVAIALATTSTPSVTTSTTDELGVTQVIRRLGRTAIAATLVSVAATTISSTVPLLIAAQPGGTRTDMAIGVALATFSLALALGGIVGSALVARLPPAVVLPFTLAGATMTGATALVLGPSGATFVALLAVTGIMIGPAVPVLLVAAQDQLPDSAAAASGVVLGLANGIAGVAFLVIATTHGAFGLEAGALVALLGLVPAAILSRTDKGNLPLDIGRLCPVTTSCGCPLPDVRLVQR